MWDWADPKAFLHDEISTDKRNPRVNANGPVYGSLELAPTTCQSVDPNDARCRRSSPWRFAIPKTPRVANGDAGAVALLGRRGAAGRAGPSPQLCDGRPGACVDRADNPSESDARVLPGRLEPPVGEGVSHRPERPPGLRVRSEDEEVHASSICASRHTICSLPRTPTTRSGSAAVAVRWSDGSTRSSSTKRKTRPEGAGMDGVHPRHERQREA